VGLAGQPHPQRSGPKAVRTVAAAQHRGKVSHRGVWKLRWVAVSGLETAVWPWDTHDDPSDGKPASSRSCLDIEHQIERTLRGFRDAGTNAPAVAIVVGQAAGAAQQLATQLSAQSR
jgi:hypothetical protein